MKLTIEEIKDLLLELDYPNQPQLLESVSRQLLSLTGESKSAFIKWYESRELPDFEIEGITPAFLRKYHSMTDVAIILAYARLLKEPKAAAFVLKKPIIKH